MAITGVTKLAYYILPSFFSVSACAISNIMHIMTVKKDKKPLSKCISDRLMVSDRRATQKSKHSGNFGDFFYHFIFAGMAKKLVK